jgi:hypothetical protein
MMHSHSPSPQQLAVPGIGFPQNISVGSNPLDQAAVRDLSRATYVTESRNIDDQHNVLRQLFDRITWFSVRR